MAPNDGNTFTIGVLHEDDLLLRRETKCKVIEKNTVNKTVYNFKLKLVWRNIILFTILHATALVGLVLIFTSAKIQTTLFGKFLIFSLKFLKIFKQ